MVSKHTNSAVLLVIFSIIKYIWVRETVINVLIKPYFDHGRLLVYDNFYILVNVATNLLYHTASLLEKPDRRGNIIKKPQCIFDYKDAEKGVDLSDQISESIKKGIEIVPKSRNRNFLWIRYDQCLVFIQ